MKIAFPVRENRGLESPVYTHFGSAPLFIILETSGGAFEAVENTDAHHMHGQCQPMKALGDHPVDAVVVGGIGAGALGRLQAAGVRVYRALEGSVSENLEVMKSGKLPEFMPGMTCAGHGAEGGCSH